MQAQFNALAASLGGENAHFAFFYDESLSHLIYAGCDIIAVPSMFEPCGLTQVRLSRLSAVFPLPQNQLPHYCGLNTLMRGEDTIKQRQSPSCKLRLPMQPSHPLAAEVVVTA